MIDPANLGTTAMLVGAIMALAEAIKYLVRSQRDKIAPKDANGESGIKSVEFWRTEIRKAIKEVQAETSAQRKQEIREVIREEIH